MKKVYDRLQAAIDAIDGVAVTLACLVLFALMVVVVCDVAMRYAFNSPLTWSYEVIEHFLMPGLFFLAVSHTLGANAHVSVDIIHNYLRPRRRYLLEAVSHILSTPAFAIAAWYSLWQTVEQFQAGTRLSSGLELPTWCTSVLLPVGMGLLTLRALLRAIGFAASLGVRHPFLALPPISGTEENYE